MVTRRYIIHNENGAVPIIETLIAVGISVVLLTVFFTSAINFFTVYDRPDIDLNAKGSGVMEMLLNSPGQGLNNSKNWDEGGPKDVEVLGLGTSQTVEYGILQITDEGEIIIHSRHSFSNNIGVVETCFLAGTKVLMADDLYNNIEEIDVGDFVKSYDEETDKLVAGRVTQVFHYSPEEMISDYYLVINDQLRVTPSHRFYSNGEWVYARDLKIGDMLFHSLSDNTIYSIERIFEKRPVYDLEVAVYHTYFVAMDTADVLVHNQALPTAEFTWFDCDGPFRSGRKIAFDASSSEFPGEGGNPWYSWWWDWVEGSSDPNNPDHNIENDPIAYKTYYNDIPHVVRLLVSDTIGNDSCIYTVQANTFDPPDIAPGTETDLVVYPETGSVTFMPYDENHYVKYTKLNEDGYYLYEIKEKTNSPYTILDYQKIIGLTGVNYPAAKSALGFSTQKYSAYNFNISVSADSGAIIPSYGASYAHPTITASYCISREVVIYHPPGDLNGDKVIDELPYYENGRITVRMFIGGIAPKPNYPPYTPSEPSPYDGAIGVGLNADLSWTGGDPNGDDLVFDIYFGESSTPPLVYVGYPETSYDPGALDFDTTYYWQIVAWDSHDAKTEGPTWSFTTGANNLPNTPSDPDPENGAKHVSVTTILSWSCSDPDGDPLSYNVYFSTVNWSGGLPPLPKMTDNNFYDPSSDDGRLEYDTTYYWMIGAKDGYGITFGPIWNFTTAEKGLDQYNTEGSGEGISTEEYLGQTFTAGRTGNLTNIKLSLKYEGGAPPPNEDITVNLYECESGDPNDLGELLATTIIESFDDTSFVWENAIFDTPAEVTEGHMYFIEIPQTEKIYSWQYSGRAVTPGGAGGSNYPGGDAWHAPDEWVKPENVDDFLFKTYVFRDPEIDQSCLSQTGNGIDTTFDLAQTFRAGRVGDLMKVNLSFACIGSSSDITVEIYSGTPEDWEGEEMPIATTTIEGFDDEGFVWKEAVFSNVPFLKEGEKYSIVIPSVQLYEWEMNEGDAYGEGAAWQKVGGGKWRLLKDRDFIFVTYMDEFG